MTIADAFKQHEDLYRASIISQTYGHLAPTMYRRYKGHLTFCIGCHGDLTVIDWVFGKLPSSPWIYQDLHAFVERFAESHTSDDDIGVYVFTGSYTRKKSEAILSGNLTKVSIKVS